MSQGRIRALAATLGIAACQSPPALEPPVAAPPVAHGAADSAIIRQPTAAGPMLSAPPASEPTAPAGGALDPAKLQGALTWYLAIQSSLAKGNTAGVDAAARKLAKAALAGGLPDVATAAAKLPGASLTEARALLKNFSGPLAKAVLANRNLGAHAAVMRCDATGTTWIQKDRDVPRSPYSGDPPGCGQPVN